MNPLRILIPILCIALCSQAVAELQDIDKELSDLAERLAQPIKEHGKTKVAVIDFTDLQGNSEGELGKYIAEQLTVNFVMGKREFAVLDRANLRKILAEHKLTSQGLVDPENAKKLGMFAGVDALVIGTIIPKGSNTISLTAKIVTTDTAEIVGAARAEFKFDDAVRQLVAIPIATPGEGQSEPTSPPVMRKPFGDLQAKVESFKMRTGDASYGFADITIIITNASDSTTYGVAFLSDPNSNFNLRNNRGDAFRANDLRGVETVSEQDARSGDSMSEIPPKSSILISSDSQTMWSGKPGDYRPYRLQTEVFFGVEKQGRYPDVKKYNLILDIK